MSELPYSILTVLLIVAMQSARWQGRRWLGWKASSSAAKKNPFDATVLLVCQVLWATAIAVYLLVPAWIAFAHVGLPNWTRWAGFLVGISGAFLVGWADRVLGANLSGVVQIKEGQNLITAGPYGLVRHPIYVGGLLYSLSLFIVSANLLVGSTIIGGTILLYVTRIPKEEAMMIDAFGDEYRRYAQRTGRFLPRFVGRSNTGG